MPSLTVALTGAAGYIASHVAIALFDRGHHVVGFDNFANSSPIVLDRIAELADTAMPFAQIDLAETDRVAEFLRHHKVDAVIHFAGLKAVGESVEDPLRYYRTNVAGTISLLDAMAQAQVTGVVFSSSATVYEPDQPMPLVESARLGPNNPYGRTKLMIEDMLRDIAATGQLSAINLRYFNPVGAHPSGRIGEDPTGVPNNLMPFVMQTAVGRRDEIQVFGDDYDTPDGTAIRDYIHVCDLADGHVAAVEALDQIDGHQSINLGTGIPSSVLEVIAAAEQAIDKPLARRVVGRRDGDAAISCADPALAHKLLGWRAKRDLADACVDHWRWQQHNPHGYTDRGSPSTG